MSDASRIAIDVGGTFTDVVRIRAGEVGFEKVPTTPKDPKAGVLNGFEAAGVPFDEIDYFIHGTTLGLNALLTRRGAKTGIVTTEGFRDVYLLGRTARDPMYDFKYRRPDSLVARYDIFEVPERLDFEGNVLREFDEARAREVAAAVASGGLESVAICFLHSYANPEHEIRMAEILSEVAPEVEVTRSSALSREIREYERTSTAVLDAYIKPIVRSYLRELSGGLQGAGFTGQFLMTRSGGGAMTAESVQEAPVNLILSGPAGGVLGAAWLARNPKYANLITIDMGGTSLDASLVVDGNPLTYFDAQFESLPINLPSLYIHTIGAGGGSLLWMDEGDHLQVGPASAGADPGPAAYGTGGEDATFTDCALHVGYLGHEAALAGTLSLEPALAAGALAPLSERLGLSTQDVALGAIRISTTKIVGAVRSITIELGHNPSDFGLLAFGGGGGLVAVDVARELSIPTVIVPPGPGAFSAFGMLMANVQHDFSRTLMSPLEGCDVGEVEQLFQQMESEGATSLEAEGFAADRREFQRFIDLRYVGQEHTVKIPTAAPFDAAAVGHAAEAFAEAHLRTYGHTMPDPVEIVAIRVSGTGRVDQPTLPTLAAASGAPEPIGSREVYRGSGRSQTYLVFERDSLLSGHEILGPAIILEHTSTTVMHEGDRCLVGELGELEITVRQENSNV